MKNHKRRSLFYSVIVHIVLLGVVMVSVWLVSSKIEKKVTSPHYAVVLMSQVVSSAEVPSPPKKVVKTKQHKRVKPKKHIVKPPKKKRLKPEKRVVTPKREVPLKKQVEEVKKAIVPEPVSEPKEIKKMEEEAPSEEVRELVLTPDKPVSLSAGAKKKIAAPVTPQTTPEERYVKAHISEIMALLRKHLYYPRMARKRHMQGKVMVRFELLADGSIRNITVVEAKRELLGKAAVTTIERLEGKFPAPSETLVLHVPIMYKLR